MEKTESNLQKRNSKQQKEREEREQEELELQLELAKFPKKERHSQALWLCIQGVRKFMLDYQIVKELKKTLGCYSDVNFDMIFKEKNKNYFFIKFKDQESIETFENAFPITIKNRKLKVKKADFLTSNEKRARTFEDVFSYMEKRTENHRKYIPPNQEFLEKITKEKVIEIMRSKICGYADLDYKTQIERKKAKLREYLRTIKSEARKQTDNTYHSLEWILKEVEVTEQPDDDYSAELCCPLEQFVECPESDRTFYRNKNEFTIGKCLLTNKIKVGFNVSEPKEHFFTIERGEKFEDPLTCPKQAFQIAAIVEDIINESGIGEWTKYDVESGKNGFWRNLIVRMSGVTKEILVNLVGRKDYFKERQNDQLEQREDFTFEECIKKDFVNKFLEKFDSSEILKDFKLKGLTYQDNRGSSDAVPYVEDNELEVLAGEGTVYHEKILGNLFEISNSSFLQVNSAVMDKMYEFAGNFIKIDQETILLDICSGIGTIGISVGQNAQKIIGIEMIASSCENAKRNAERNKVEYEVICSKVEDVINNIAEKYNGKRLVGIIDPPRAGLHPSVTKILRTCKGLNELVFMACDLNQSKRNILELCLPANGKKRKGPEFIPVSAAGVDMFPNTKHFESIFYLKRRDMNIEKPSAVYEKAEEELEEGDVGKEE